MIRIYLRSSSIAIIPELSIIYFLELQVLEIISVVTVAVVITEEPSLLLVVGRVILSLHLVVHYLPETLHVFVSFKAFGLEFGEVVGQDVLLATADDMVH